MKTSPAENTMSEPTTIGIKEAVAAAMSPAKIGGRDWPRDETEELTPITSPRIFSGVSLVRKEEKFAICTPFGMEARGTIKSKNQGLVGTRYKSTPTAFSI